MALAINKQKQKQNIRNVFVSHKQHYEIMQTEAGEIIVFKMGEMGNKISSFMVF